MPHDDIVGDPRVRSMIRRTVRRMLTQETFAGHTGEDLEQDLFLALVKGLSRFDAAVAHHNVFAKVIVKRAVGNMLRHSRAQKRDGGLWYQPSVDRLDYRHPNERQRDLALDVNQVLTRQPAHLANLAELLKSHSLAEAARILDVPRTTLRRWVVRLAEVLAEAKLQNS